MKRAFALISVFLFFAVLAVGGHADDDNIDDAIQNTILSQIEAFANDDRQAAWDHASEGYPMRPSTGPRPLSSWSAYPTPVSRFRWYGCWGRRANAGSPTTIWSRMVMTGKSAASDSKRDQALYSR